ncbi:MAG: sigma-70 family RNA polymerase sigma factor [Bauldia sp.]|nr:sigma-70 family RNA polymerase sigma factor [Bauldia sp.]
MIAAQGGDQVAYRALLSAAVPVVRRVARAIGVPPASVDDVVQETLLSMHRLLHTYDPARPFAPWLNAIARRRSIDMLRAQGRRSTREVHAPIAYEAHAEEEDRYVAVEMKGDAERLRPAINALPEGQREAVKLLGLDGYTLAESAELSGKTKTALKVSFHRAIKSLRARLEGSG